MPYKSNDELPEAIKSNLPASAQSIWRESFNGAEKQYPGDEERSAKIAWGAVKNAGWEKDGDKWIKHTYSELYNLENREIFSVGTWKGDKYTEEDLDDIIKNFNELKADIKPPLKLGHYDSMNDGKPAIGWISSLKRVGGKLLADFTNIPKIVYDAIKKGGYKRVSSEIIWNYKKDGKLHKKVLAGVALLGANLPAVTNLQDLNAFFSKGDGMIKIYEFNLEKEVGNSMEINELKKQYEANLQLAQEKYAKKLEEIQNANKEQLKKYEAELTELKAKQISEKRNSDIVVVKTFCDTSIKDGKMTPAMAEIITKDLDKRTYSQDTGFLFTFDQLKEYVKITPKIVDFGEYGQRGSDDKKYTDPGMELDRLAKKYSAEHKVDYSDALVAVLQENPTLGGKYMNDYASKGGDE
jgi:cation transport regulator